MTLGESKVFIENERMKMFRFNIKSSRSRKYWAPVLQLLSPCAIEPVHRDKRSHHDEKFTYLN